MSAARTIERNVTVVQRIHAEVWSAGDLSVVNELYAPEFIGHPVHGPAWHGPEGVKAVVVLVRRAFPDWIETVEDVIAQGDRVATRWIAHGTHAGEFLGVPATGRRVAVTEMALFRLTGGKIVEQWTVTDLFGLLRQLGTAPPVAPQGRQDF